MALTKYKLAKMPAYYKTKIGDIAVDWLFSH
jgi:hypothetical protein